MLFYTIIYDYEKTIYFKWNRSGIRINYTNYNKATLKQKQAEHKYYSSSTWVSAIKYECSGNCRWRKKLVSLNELGRQLLEKSFMVFHKSPNAVIKCRIQIVIYEPHFKLQISSLGITLTHVTISSDRPSKNNKLAFEKWDRKYFLNNKESFHSWKCHPQKYWQVIFYRNLLTSWESGKVDSKINKSPSSQQNRNRLRLLTF